MQIDLTSSAPITRMDGFLLLLGAQNQLLFRLEDRRSQDIAVESEILSRATRTFQDAMWRLRKGK